MNTDGLVDYRNRDLWALLSLTNTIKLTTHPKPYYEVGHYDSYSLILIGQGKRCPASFTHELLHIYLRNKGISVSQHLTTHIKGKPNLSIYLSRALLDHLCNALDHIKMLPLYLDLGFERNLFISDYDVNKIDKEDLLFLKQYFTPKFTLWGHAFDQYVGRYFSIISCPNESYNYSDGLTQMQQLNSDLFGILERFTIRWKEFEYEGMNNTPEMCGIMISTLLSEMEEWSKPITFR